ncbi:hypothetical protein H2200_007095 [Cladophialophora chaetospira]|uniref:Uncharacterized protein n=1 Tax=Cladophialophora chaetospira TaxID=386627 RepID=A0AA38X762_9EURO|nr:hypothetical protein H2200_007095 [Cladophialophora chaetospira]
MPTDYGTWVIDEVGDCHVCNVRGLLQDLWTEQNEHGEKVVYGSLYLPVWLPDVTLQDGKKIPGIHKHLDYLHLVRVKLGSPGGNSYSTISVKQLASGLDEVVRAEVFQVQVGKETPATWEVWRDDDGGSPQLLAKHHKNGRFEGLVVVSIPTLNEQQRNAQKLQDLLGVINELQNFM